MTTSRSSSWSLSTFRSLSTSPGSSLNSRKSSIYGSSSSSSTSGLSALVLPLFPPNSRAFAWSRYSSVERSTRGHVSLYQTWNNVEIIQTKNYMSLWCQIAKEKNSSLKFNISSLQVINKYYNWNKRWKEVRDSAGSRGSGTEAKYFRQKKAFDQLYGTKGSTKPACILDTFDTKEEETTTNKKNHTNQNKIDENKSSDQTCQKNRRKDKKRTRKASGLGETLEKRNTEFTNKLGQLHMAQNGYIRSSAWFVRTRGEYC